MDDAGGKTTTGRRADKNEALLARFFLLFVVSCGPQTLGVSTEGLVEAFVNKEVCSFQHRHYGFLVIIRGWRSLVVLFFRETLKIQLRGDFELFVAISSPRLAALGS